MTDHLSQLNCALIPRALENLKREGLAATSQLTGDVMLDCFLHYRQFADFSLNEKLKLRPGEYHIATVHRTENTQDKTDSRFFEILKAFSQLDKTIVFPIHPRTHKLYQIYVKNYGKIDNIISLEPVSYFQMHGLLQHCDCVLTDSGGLPRETVWSGKRCVMLLQKDIWHDFIELGFAQSAKGDHKTILHVYQHAVTPDAKRAQTLFGAGLAAKNIAAGIDALI